MAQVGARSGGEGGEVENGGAGMGRVARRTSKPSMSAPRRPRSPGVIGPPPEARSPTLFALLLF